MRTLLLSLIAFSLYPFAAISAQAQLATQSSNTATGAPNVVTVPMPGNAMVEIPQPVENDPAPECRKARNPKYCRDARLAQEACKDKRGAEKFTCVQDSMPEIDCSRTKMPEQCASYEAVRAACRGTLGYARRACLLDAQAAQTDCSKAEDIAHCEFLQQAQQSCKGKFGIARTECLRAYKKNNPVTKLPTKEKAAEGEPQ